MHARVVGELGMKGGDQDVALDRRDAVTLDLGEHLHAGARRLDPRPADEHRVQRALAEGRRPQIDLETVHLTPERVAPRDDVDEAPAAADRASRPCRAPA